MIDADIAKDYLARWCVTRGLYADLPGRPLPDGGVLRPRELSPLLQTTSTEVCNAVRRAALVGRLDVVIGRTMASPADGDRLLQSLAKADYDRLHIVSVETDRDSAGSRAKERWWQGRNDDPAMGGRLILPETIDHAYIAGRERSVCRANARALATTIRSGGTAVEHVTLAEYDDGTLTLLDADPPRSVNEPGL